LAKRGRGRNPRDGDDHDHDHDHDHEHAREHSDRRGRDFPVFSKTVGARWRGSAEPTAQAYARALAQWRRLPGAIGATATDLGNAADPANPAGDSPTKKGAP
jgi:hypothetical protein